MGLPQHMHRGVSREAGSCGGWKKGDQRSKEMQMERPEAPFQNQPFLLVYPQPLSLTK